MKSKLKFSQKQLKEFRKSLCEQTPMFLKLLSQTDPEKLKLFQKRKNNG